MILESLLIVPLAPQEFLLETPSVDLTSEAGSFLASPSLAVATAVVAHDPSNTALVVASIALVTSDIAHVLSCVVEIFLQLLFVPWRPNYMQPMEEQSLSSLIFTCRPSISWIHNNMLLNPHPSLPNNRAKVSLQQSLNFYKCAATFFKPHTLLPLYKASTLLLGFTP